jgi:hypothetical protein
MTRVAFSHLVGSFGIFSVTMRLHGVCACNVHDLVLELLRSARVKRKGLVVDETPCISLGFCWQIHYCDNYTPVQVGQIYGWSMHVICIHKSSASWCLLVEVVVRRHLVRVPYFLVDDLTTNRGPSLRYALSYHLRSARTIPVSSEAVQKHERLHRLLSQSSHF